MKASPPHNTIARIGAGIAALCLAPAIASAYTLDIFSGAFTGVRLSSQTLDDTTTGMFASDNASITTSTNYWAATSGNYRVASEVASSPRRSEVNFETTANSGSAPAEASAYSGSSTNDEQTRGGRVAFQVNATPVPVPPTALLFGGGLLTLLGFLGLRRSGVAVRKGSQKRE